MALTPERIMELEQQSYVKGLRPVRTEDCWGDEKTTYKPTSHFNMFMFARAIEAEVRKSDDALIQQLVEALDGSIAITMGKIDLRNAAIAAARARLGGQHD